MQFISCLCIAWGLDVSTNHMWYTWREAGESKLSKSCLLKSMPDQQGRIQPSPHPATLVQVVAWRLHITAWSCHVDFSCLFRQFIAIGGKWLGVWLCNGQRDPRIVSYAL